MEKIKEVIENISPVLIKPKSSSLTIGISKRFFLFNMMRRIVNIIEEDPHLNFVAILKSYKVLGRILTGTVHEFYRDRNRIYFKRFFAELELWEQVKDDLESLYPKYKDVKMTITKQGLLIYDNYNKNTFNVLLITAHSGLWVPEYTEKKLSLSKNFRFKEEDIDTNKIYRNLVLEKSGIWIDNKMSRFACDFNRNMDKAIYDTKSEISWSVEKLWKEELTEKERDENLSAYRNFYFALARVLDSYRFNIIFDGHSMKDLDGRPNISFGVRYIPKFYMPIVYGMQRKLKNMGYDSVKFNSPYGGGYILKWLSTKFPDIFICSMEVNKKLYMNKSRTKSIESKVGSISKDLQEIFDIDLDDAEK